MATIDLGRVTPIFHGDYDSTATYELNDLVIFNDDMYWHVSDTPTTGTDPTDATVWKLAIAGAAADLSIALAAFPTDTASGPVASFADGAENIPVKSLEVQVNAPAGVTGANIYVTGVNQWDEQWELGRYDQTTGLPVANNTAIRSKNAIPVRPSTTYYYNLARSGGFALYYQLDGTYLNAVQMAASGTYTTPANCYFVRFYMFGTYGTTYNNNISVNYPSTDTAYHAYAGAVYAVDWTSEAGAVTTGTLTYKGGGAWEIDDGAPVELPGPDPATRLGANSIWTDTGDITVQYRADTALYIDKKLGA